jgi:hypothetical protein
LHAFDLAGLGRRRIVLRQRRAQALHPPAFLVDEDEGVRPADAVAHRGDKVPHLFRFPDVAGEQDETPRPFSADEGDVFRAQGLAGHADDHGF